MRKGCCVECILFTIWKWKSAFPSAIHSWDVSDHVSKIPLMFAMEVLRTRLHLKLTLKSTEVLFSKMVPTLVSHYLISSWKKVKMLWVV